MPFFLNKPAAEDSILPSYTSSQGSSAGSIPSEPPPAYALHISERPPFILGSLLPRSIRSRLNGEALPLSDPPHGSCTQADTPPAGSASDQKQPVTFQARPHCVQVCPHQVLSFERFQRIMSLPGFKGSVKKLDALMAGPDHVDFFSSTNWLCKPRPISFNGLETYSDYCCSSSQHLILTTRWLLPKSIPQSHSSSRSELQGFLRNWDIKLCPHKGFDDPWVVEVLYRMAHPKERLADPLDQWEADAEYAINANGSCEARCQHCSINYRTISSTPFATLYVTRDLGKGISPLDPVWLAQCVVEAEEEQAM